MRKRQTLNLMELTVMLLVFALAAALCLRLFVWADRRSQENACRDTALTDMQNAAEALRHCSGDYDAATALLGGTWDGTLWIIDYGSHQIRVTPQAPGSPYLGSARVEALCRGEPLFSITVHWQEVTAHA